MNVIAITGNICKDLELRYTNNNKMVLDNTVAVRKGIKNEDGTYGSDFIDFVCFEKKAEYLSTYAKKGDKIEINGKLRVDNWKDDNGEYHTRSYVVADSVQILTSRKIEKNEEEKKEANPFEDFGNNLEITDDDLPF